ncbi:LysR family transcriptional regulator [Achromobacter sp. CSND-B12]|uniref:LysR family transcriptional regulator n=1 Tax=Achromobacter sp. CSND-B12 TaxID=3462570 RepID=UPI00406A9D0D
MELRHLRHFVVTAEQESIASAARILCMVQPALTRSIQTLEESVGAQLFVRHARGVKLTAAGRQCYQDATRLLQEAAQMRNNAVRASEGALGNLHLAISPQHAWLPLICRMLGQFRDEHPLVTLMLDMLQSGGQLDGILRGDLDAGFMFMRPRRNPSLAGLLVHEEHLVLAVPENSPYAKSPPKRLSELSGEPYIGTPKASSLHFNDFVEDEYRRLNFQPRIVQMGSNFLVMLGLVAAGMGIAVVPGVSRFMHPRGIVFHEVPDLDSRLELELVWRSNDDSPVLARFLDVARRTCAEDGVGERDWARHREGATTSA